MKRIWIIATAVALALVLAVPAAAKGPDRATITGPGLDEPIVLGGDAEGDVSSTFGRFAEGAGFMYAVFRQTPNQLLAGRPQGDLGPKYEIVWRVPGGETHTAFARQALYPYAPGGPVTYMRPGQPLFGGEHLTHGGWFRSLDRSFKEQLVSLGFPKTAPELSATASAVVRKKSEQRMGRWLPIAFAGLVLPAAFFAVRFRRH
jgi:hypothetical protein